MDPVWIIVPLVGAVIGYVTNTIAVTMLFRPHEPKRFGFFKLHGLIPKRHDDLARKIGQVVGTHLVEHRDVLGAIAKLDLEPMVGELIDAALEKKLAELQALPMIGAFLTPDRLSGLRDGIVKAVVEQEDVLVEHLERALDDGLDVAATVEQKVAGFPTTQMEQLVLEVARRELRAIEVWGAVLGALIGIGQVVAIELLK